MFLQKYINTVKQQPLAFFMGSCVLFLAVMGTSVIHVASTSFALLVITGLFDIKQWGNVWSDLTRGEKLMLYGFSLYALSGLISYVNVEDVDEYIKDFERYFRFLLTVPIYLVLRRHNIDIIKYLYVGAVISGPFLLIVALSSYFDNPNVPSRGYYHHIIFGSLAMLNIGVMLSILLTSKINHTLRLIVLVSMTCAFIAALLSQSRGVWLAVPAYILIILYITWRRSKLSMIIAAAVIGIIFIAASQSPVGDMVRQRVTVAIDEIASFYKDEKYITSVGTRLAMWDMALGVWEKNPLIGTGPGDFDNEIMQLQKKGAYVGMERHASTHNIYVQALVSTGLIGLLALLFSMFYQPIKLMYLSRFNNKTTSLTGSTVLLLFAVVGLSESWILRLPTVSIYIIYVLTVISSLYANDAAGNKREHI